MRREACAGGAGRIRASRDRRPSEPAAGPFSSCSRRGSRRTPVSVCGRDDRGALGVIFLIAGTALIDVVVSSNSAHRLLALETRWEGRPRSDDRAGPRPSPHSRCGDAKHGEPVRAGSVVREPGRLGARFREPAPRPWGSLRIAYVGDGVPGGCTAADWLGGVRRPAAAGLPAGSCFPGRHLPAGAAAKPEDQGDVRRRRRSLSSTVHHALDARPGQRRELSRSRQRPEHPQSDVTDFVGNPARPSPA